ncbi:arsenate reductase (glutaredoxin) [Brevundimonas sp. NPDC090276]|uniref:arsenate reductase (glutaredoxin) n=1 Tax=Brevundimonas sp. NPDC090276 TaxID=3363956 RepID=UPI003839D76D
MDVVIYHNPACGTSRNTLALIRHVGIEPHVIEYMRTSPSRAMIQDLAKRMGVPLLSLLREKGTPFTELGLGDPALTDDQILDAIDAHPVLLNRPIVVSPLGVKLCRPSEAVLGLLPPEGLKPFTKEDGEVVINADGWRLR